MSGTNAAGSSVVVIREVSGVVAAFTLVFASACGSGVIRDRADSGDPGGDGQVSQPDGSGNDASGTDQDSGPADAAVVCSGSAGLDVNGHCRVACGGAPSCEGLAPDALAAGCGAGHPAVQDRCTATCAVADDAAAVCGPAGVGDCPGDPECAGLPPDLGACDQDCHYTDPCGQPGWVRVYIDGAQIFDEPAAKSLICDGMHFVAGWGCGAGPPGAQVVPVTDLPGLFEGELHNFQDDHGNCEEKWCFLRLQGQCSEVMLEKWNWNPCNTEYQTDELKLEIWVDQNNNCSYDGWENWEPYGGHISWDPSHVYQVRIEYF